MRNKKETKKMWLIGYADPSCRIYKPKVNRKRQVALLLAFIPFFFTVGTNWLYFIGLNTLLKLNPLFLYQ